MRLQNAAASNGCRPSLCIRAIPVAYPPLRWRRRWHRFARGRYCQKAFEKRFPTSPYASETVQTFAYYSLYFFSLITTPGETAIPPTSPYASETVESPSPPVWRVRHRNNANNRQRSVQTFAYYSRYLFALFIRVISVAYSPLQLATAIPPFRA